MVVEDLPLALSKSFHLSGLQVPNQQSAGLRGGLRCIPVVAGLNLGKVEGGCGQPRGDNGQQLQWWQVGCRDAEVCRRELGGRVHRTWYPVGVNCGYKSL
jgi:hypothetical protein